MRQLVQAHGQDVAVVGARARDVAAALEAGEDPEDLVHRAAELGRDARLGHAFGARGQKLKDVEPLLERRRAVARTCARRQPARASRVGSRDVVYSLTHATVPAETQTCGSHRKGHGPNAGRSSGGRIRDAEGAMVKPSSGSRRCSSCSASALAGPARRRCRRHSAGPDQWSRWMALAVVVRRTKEGERQGRVGGGSRTGACAGPPRLAAHAPRRSAGSPDRRQGRPRATHRSRRLGRSRAARPLRRPPCSGGGRRPWGGRTERRAPAPPQGERDPGRRAIQRMPADAAGGMSHLRRDSAGTRRRRAQPAPGRHPARGSHVHASAW